MKKDVFMLLTLVTVVLLAGFYFGERFAQLRISQQSTCTAINNHEARLLPLEQDFQRRKKIRGGFSKMLGWFRGKLGL